MVDLEFDNTCQIQNVSVEIDQIEAKGLKSLRSHTLTFKIDHRDF